jgi:hypothetical protein
MLGHEQGGYTRSEPAEPIAADVVDKLVWTPRSRRKRVDDVVILEYLAPLVEDVPGEGLPVLYLGTRFVYSLWGVQLSTACCAPLELSTRIMRNRSHVNPIDETCAGGTNKAFLCRRVGRGARAGGGPGALTF